MRLSFCVTFVSIIGNVLEINIVGAYHSIVDGIIVSDLDLDAGTQRRKHFTEHDLFVPDGVVAVLFHTGLTLETK